MTTIEGVRVTAVGETEETMVVGSMVMEVVGYKMLKILFMVMGI